MKGGFRNRLFLYQLTVVFSVIFALAGFSYNVWRMEVSERNNNIRTASFEMLLTLSDLEQLVYSAHYDGDRREGSPRKGWVKVGLIADLALLTNQPVADQAQLLRTTWEKHWNGMADSRESADSIVTAIDAVRRELKQGLVGLE